MPRVADIWRHPIKSHGREAVGSVTLTAGQTMPWDRVWAVAHEASTADGSTWVPWTNFSIVSKAPALMAVTAVLDEQQETVTLRHPERPDISVSPDRDPQALLDWARPLMPDNRAASARVLRVPGRGMTDTDYPSITLCNLASHRAVEARMGRDLSPLRWRANFWLDGLNAWEEFDWIGKTIALGEAEVTVRERTVRCLATTSNPDTGARDADTLAALTAGWGHKDFCVYAEVTKSGLVRTGDTVVVH